MRRLAIASISLSVAVFVAYYLLPLPAVTPLALASGFCALFCFILRRRGSSLYRCFLIFIGAALGFACFRLQWDRTIRWAERWDASEQVLSVRVLEYPQEYAHYTRVHVERVDTPKLGIMIYDYEGNTTDLKPGDMLHVDVKLRRADLRYGERNDSFVSKDIWMTGTLQSLQKSATGRQWSLQTLSAVCSRKVSDYAATVFSEKTGSFLRSLMLGDKADFYRDLPVYAAMRGAGFMHIVAVSGVQYLFFGFYRIARKPVNSGFFGTRPCECREKLHFT